jgi:Flp pilus assembly protein TadG
MSILRRFRGDKRGVSAVEFALLAPMMIALYLGCVEVSDGVSADRKVSLTASTVANLTSQVSTITNADMTNILNASSAIIAPYASSKLKVTVSCLNIDSTGKVTVEWSDTKNGTARTKGSSVTIPSALAVPSSHLIFAEVSYAYTPTVGYTMTGTVNLSDTMYMAPRVSATVARTTS